MFEAFLREGSGAELEDEFVVGVGMPVRFDLWVGEEVVYEVAAVGGFVSCLWGRMGGLRCEGEDVVAVEVVYGSRAFSEVFGGG